MLISPFTARLSFTGIAYFATASLAVSLTRYGGGVAFLWVASSLLIADLMGRPRRQWWPVIAVCAVASVVATGLFGFGWAAAVPFAVINMTEGIIAALAFRHFGHSLRPLGSLSWLMHFVASVGIAAPLVCAPLAAGAVWMMGRPPGEAFVNFFTGHALGNITFTPVVLLFARGNLAKTLKDARRRDTAETVTLLLLVLGVSVAVFRQATLPLLFLPILPLILVTFRVGRGGAAVAIGILALVGGGATMAGWGPIQLLVTNSGTQLQFFQFYLATTVLTILPVAADLQNRARLHRDMRMSEERYRLMAEHSSDILFHLDPDGRIRYVSPSMLQIGGHRPATLVGQNSAS